MAIERAIVESSQIRSIGHDADKSMLEIEFNDGSVYQYANVPEELHERLMQADSVGSFFSKIIKGKSGYPCAKIQDGGGTRKGKATLDEVSKAKDDAPDPKLVESVAMTMPERARKFMIRDNKDYERAAEFLKSIKALRGQVDEAFDPTIAKAHETHKTAIAAKKKAEAPLVEAEQIMKVSVGGWLRIQDQAAKDEEARIRREHEDKVRKQAEEENLKEAQRLADAGDMDGAAAAVDAEITVPDIPVHVESSAPKVSGISKRTLYVVASVELSKLVKAVAEGRAPLECLKANDSFLGAQARAYKKAGELFPGVVVKDEDSIAAGRS